MPLIRLQASGSTATALHTMSQSRTSSTSHTPCSGSRVPGRRRGGRPSATTMSPMARNPLLGPLFDFAATLRFPQLFLLILGLFVLDLLLPDGLPFVDEILLGLGALLLGNLRKRRSMAVAVRTRRCPACAGTGSRRGCWPCPWRRGWSARSRGRTRRAGPCRSGAGRGTTSSASFGSSISSSRRSSTSSRSSRWEPPMISPMPGASTSIAATVFPSSFMPHVERLDLLRVVHHDHRPPDELLGQVALVLGLQVACPTRPGTRTSAPSPGLLQGLDRVGVVHPLEAGLDELLEPRRCTSLSMRSAKNSMSSARSSSTARKMYLRKSSARSASSSRSANAISGSIIQNSARWRLVLRVLGAERRAERVDLGQRQAVRLDVELAGDRQEGLACRRSPARSRCARPACAAGSPGPASTRGTSRRRPRSRWPVMIGVWIQKKPRSWK